MPFVKEIKNRQYFKRFQVKFRRRRSKCVSLGADFARIIDLVMRVAIIMFHSSSSTNFDVHC